MLTLIRIKNTNAKTFLQGQLTCDVNKINELYSSLGGYCELKGRLIANFRLFTFRDDYYLALPSDTAKGCINDLKKYGVFSKIIIEQANDMSIYGIVCDGDGSSDSDSDGNNINQQLSEILTLKELPTSPNDVVQTASFCIIRCHGEQPRYLITGLTNYLYQISADLKQANLIANDNTWQLAEIDAGIPNITAGTIAKFTPHEINLPSLDGVSFNKGCYRGQEIVARMHYRGKLKQHMYRANLVDDKKLLLFPGDELQTTGDTNAGYVVNCAYDDKNKQWQLLATVKDEAKKNDAVFYQSHKLEFVDLPYNIQK